MTKIEMPKEAKAINQTIGRLIKEAMPPGWGFALLVFELNTNAGSMNYLSNARRPDMIKALKELIHNLEMDESL